MSNILPIKDKDFKKYMQDRYGVFDKHSIYKPTADYFIKIKKQYIFFECENSSRGMTSNLLKYLTMLDRNTNYIKDVLGIVFIETTKHYHLHYNDTYNFNYLTSKIQFNPHVPVFKFIDTHFFEVSESSPDPTTLYKQLLKYYLE